MFVPEAPHGVAPFENTIPPSYWPNFEQAMLVAHSSACSIRIDTASPGYHFLASATASSTRAAANASLNVLAGRRSIGPRMSDKSTATYPLPTAVMMAITC
jgi:hypothetical protein